MTKSNPRLTKIGISSNLVENGHPQLRREYIETVHRSGAVPVIIPCVDDAALINVIVANLDGVILSGGYDIDPSFYGESHSAHIGEINILRDKCEFEILRVAMKYQIPVFGICRGLQIINVALGGKLYQDIETDIEESLKSHQQCEPTNITTHLATFIAGTKSAKIVPRSEIEVNSHHHQAVKSLGKGLIVTAVSPDNIIEGIESTEHNIIAVQFHPERMPQDEYSIINSWIKKIVIPQIG